MTVLVYHVMGRLSIHVDHPTLGAYTARLGNYGVTIFFLLSGFLLYRPFVVAHFESSDGPNWRCSMSAGSSRIIPAYWVALTFLFFVFHYSHLDNVGDALTYYGFAQIYRPGGYRDRRARAGVVAVRGDDASTCCCRVLAFALAQLRFGRGELQVEAVRGNSSVSA